MERMKEHLWRGEVGAVGEGCAAVLATSNKRSRCPLASLWLADARLHLTSGIELSLASVLRRLANRQMARIGVYCTREDRKWPVAEAAPAGAYGWPKALPGQFNRSLLWRRDHASC